jgi:hypothetical protein
MTYDERTTAIVGGLALAALGAAAFCLIYAVWWLFT